MLYSRGFASVYGEWETTDEAKQQRRAFHESVRVPAPGAPVQVVVKKRGARSEFREVWSAIVDPADPAIDRGAAPKLNLAFPQIVAAYDPKRDPREPLLTPEEMKVYVETFRRTGFTGGINWYRNMTRNWQRSADLDHTVRVPSLMIMAEKDVVLPPSAADGMEKIVPDLEKHLVSGSGHWTMQEYPGEVSATILDWRRRRFG